MALNLSLPRWIALAAAGCALVALGVLSRVEDAGIRPDEFAEGPWRRAFSLRPDQQLGRNADRLRVLQIRDSVLSVMPGVVSDSMTVLVDGAISDSIARQVRAMVDRQWHALAITARVPVVVSFVLDTVRTVRGARRNAPFAMAVDYFLPTATTRGACYAQARVADFTTTTRDRFVERQRRAVLTAGASMLGPCAYLAAFGTPGPAVRRWVGQDNWILAHIADWTHVSPSLSRLPADNWVTSVDHVLGIDEQFWRVRLWLGPYAIACIAGDTASCSAAALQSGFSDGQSTWRQPVAWSSGFSTGYWGSRSDYRGMGPERTHLLSDMVVSLGRDRFQRVWSSTAPVDSAFRQVAGVDMGEWVHGWAVKLYGTDTTGPSISAMGLLSGVFVAAVAGALAMLLASRRRMVT